MTLDLKSPVLPVAVPAGEDFEMQTYVCLKSHGLRGLGPPTGPYIKNIKDAQKLVLGTPETYGNKNVTKMVPGSLEGVPKKIVKKIIK